MSEQPHPDVPQEDEREMDFRFAITELEHRVRVATLLAVLAEAGVLALALLLALNRRRSDA